MAEPKSENSKELLQRLRAGRSRIPIMRPQIVAQPDAINETLRVDGTLQRREAFRTQEEARQRQEQAQQRAQTIRRTQYRNRKKAEQAQAREAGQVLFTRTPVELLSDQAVDAAIEEEQRQAAYRANQPQMGPSNPAWSYPAETRRALGYYTQEEREQAARMNDMRSSTFLGNVMPNFGRQAAYNNPGAEMNAFRQTALYIPNAVVAGSSFGLPSATTATLAGAKAGWQTAGNLAQRTYQAGAQAVRSAAPVVTNPRWAATAASFTVPAVAQASNGDYSAAGWGIGIPLAIGVGAYLTKGKLWGKTPAATTAPAEQYAYQPDRRLFAWEYPSSWTRRQRNAIRRGRWNAAIDEWNAAVGDPAKEQAFIQKYNIREVEGTPQWIERQVTEPKTYRVPKTETVQQPVMEDVPSSVLGPDGNPLMIQRPKVNADGSPVTQSVEREVKDAWGDPVMYDKPVLDDNGQPVMETRTVHEPKLGEDGQQILTYNPIGRDDVTGFLRGDVDGYNSTLPNVDDMIFRGPTKSQQFWMRLRNVGRVGTWLGVPGFIGYQFLKPSGTTSSNNSNGNNASDSTQVASPDSVRVRNFISVTRDGRIVTPNVSGTGNDTIVPRNYETAQFDD